MQRAAPILALLLTTIVLSGTTALATHFVVAPDGSGFSRTIRAALDAAAHGDTVFVQPGVYEEQVTLKDGVRVVGAGAERTTLRYAYGFDAVVVARAMSSGSLESVSIERLSSVLAGPAVLVDGATVEFAACVITGGQESGVQVQGATARVALTDTHVTANTGPGVHVADGGRVEILRGIIERNASGAMIVGGTAEVRLRETTLRDNGRTGLSLGGSSRVTGESLSISDHSEFGIAAFDGSVLRISGSRVHHQGAACIRVEDQADATVETCELLGGETGIRLVGSATLALRSTTLRDSVGTAVDLSGTSAATVDGTVVVAARGDGIAARDTARLTVTRTTIVQCGGDALRLDGTASSVTDCLVAYNGGAGVRVRDALEVTLARNAFWANTPDYVGVGPRPGDETVAPEFVDLEGGDLALRPGSPCLETGAGWFPAGALGAAQPLVGLCVVPSLRDPWLDAVWRAELCIDGETGSCQGALLGVQWERPGLTLGAESALAGTWGGRTELRVDGEISVAYAEGAGFALGYGGEAVFDGAQTSQRIWGALGIAQPGLVARLHGGVSWPGPWSAGLRLTLGNEIRVGAEVGVLDGWLRTLGFSARTARPLGEGELEVVTHANVRPEPVAGLEALWRRGGRTASARVEAELSAPGAWRAEASLGDEAGTLSCRIRNVGGVMTDGALSLSVGLGQGRVTGELELSGSTGVRAAIRLDLSLGRWLEPRENALPVPALRVNPPDPEAATVVRFSADEAFDPDGDLVEVWWDFGDGAAATGQATEHVYAESGTFHVVVTVLDDRGAAVSLASALRVWPADTTPVAAFVAYPVSESGIRLPRPLRAGDLVRLDAMGSTDRDGALLEFAWDLGADGAFDVVGASSAAVIGPVAGGSFPVTLRVTDDSGRSDAVMQVLWVDQAEPPVAAFSLTPSTPAVGDPVRFADQSEDSDGVVASREWTFGDGTSSRDAEPVHRFSLAGSYDVALRVVDDDGLVGVAERRVTVTQIPEIAAVEEIYAVVIGISDYANVRDLAYASEDAVAFATWLVAEAGVPRANVRLLLDGREVPESLRGVETRSATLVQVREALGWLRRVARSDDLVLIHFSGHGFQGPDDDGDEADGVDEFFILHDTTDQAKEDTALRDDEFGRFLDRVASQHVVVFFDGCYSGGLSRSLPGSARPVGGVADVFADFSLEGRLVFSASRENQDAFESPELESGIFSHYVLEGLRGAADATQDDRVTAWELYDYVRISVAARVRDERGADQEPQLLGEGEVRVLLAEVPQPPEADFSLLPPSPYVGGYVAFIDQSVGSRPIVSRAWDFGDGALALGDSPTHVFGEAGLYRVTLVVTDTSGASGRVERELRVGLPGQVLQIDAGLAVISLGSEHGLAPGDRFTAANGSMLEVVEVLEARTTACRVLEGAAPEPGEIVMPASPPAGA
ncbi:MAG: PKD domain-containing protein [Candidatus Bipolaricaulota bacterium]